MENNFESFVISIGKGHGKDCGISVDGEQLPYVKSFTLRADVRDIVMLDIERYMIQQEDQIIEGSGNVSERVVFGIFSRALYPTGSPPEDDKIVFYEVSEMGEQYKRNFIVSEKEARRLYENLKEIFSEEERSE